MTTQMLHRKPGRQPHSFAHPLGGKMTIFVAHLVNIVDEANPLPTSW